LLNILDSLINVNYIENKLTIDFYEQKPPHYRNNFYDQKSIIFDKLDVFSKISKYDENSWISILWSPVRASKHSFLNTSFIVYYTLNVNDYLTKSSPIIGILPIKMENEQLWLRKFESKSNSELFNYDVYIDTLNFFLSNNTSKTSVDYDYYFKNSFSER